MSKLRILGSVSLAVLMLTAVAVAQRTGGGAARSGMRGAMVGGMVGGSSGAATGAKIGVATGVTRNVAERSTNRQAMNSETQSRTQYESTAAYQNAKHSNFNESPPEVLVSNPLAAAAVLTPGTPASRNATTTTTPTTTTAPTTTTTPATTTPATPGTPAVAAVPSSEAIIRKAGKPVLGITYPDDWKQNASENYVTAVSPKGNAWSVIAKIDAAKDKDAAIAIVKQGLDKYLQEIQYDEPTTTERGAPLVTGSGKGKKTGLPVVFAAGVFESSPGQMGGVAFVVDENVEDHYKEAVRFMCQTIRGEADFAEPHEVAKPVVREQK